MQKMQRMQQQTQEEAIKQQQFIFQMTLQSDVFRRLRDVCFEKCVRRFDGEELHDGENACLERCVDKFMSAYTIIGADFAAQTTVPILPQYQE
jgi:Tim10/DDP family zinc finger